MDPKGWELLGPVFPPRLVIGYGTVARKLRTTLFTVPISIPVISVSLDPLKSTLLFFEIMMQQWTLQHCAVFPAQPIPGLFAV